MKRLLIFTVCTIMCILIALSCSCGGSNKNGTAKEETISNEETVLAENEVLSEEETNDIEEKVLSEEEQYGFKFGSKYTFAIPGGFSADAVLYRDGTVSSTLLGEGSWNQISKHDEMFIEAVFENGLTYYFDKKGYVHDEHLKTSFLLHSQEFVPANIEEIEIGRKYYGVVLTSYTELVLNEDHTVSVNKKDAHDLVEGLKNWNETEIDGQKAIKLTAPNNSRYHAIIDRGLNFYIEYESQIGKELEGGLQPIPIL